MYHITLVCKGIPTELGPAGALDVAEEFNHRPWYRNVRCEWNGEDLLLSAENDWDGDAKALLDEFCDAVAACIPGTIGFQVEIRSITNTA